MAGNIGVVGAGLMGAEIALVYALVGYDVLLTDRTDAALKAALDRLGGILDKGIARGFYKEAEKPSALARITVTTDLARFADRDMVTEAVFEDEAVKAEIFQTLDRICRPDALIASNTSSIAISTLASHLRADRRPNFIGTHYFSPVARMKLVEEGVATPEDIDLACKLGLGHPIGPFELMDVTTSSLCLQVQEILHSAYGERFRPPSLLKQRVNAGYLGRRAGRGWLKSADRKSRS